MGPQDHLYVDLNSLLYPAVNIAADALLQRLAAAEATGTGGGGMFLHQKGSSSASTASAVSVKEAEDAILAALVTLLEKLCSICPPQKLLYIASDGVSPMGKMSHQRARRQNSTARSAARRLCDVTGFDITMLTCGSSFMARVTHASHYFATMYVERINSKRHAANCRRQHNNPNEGSSSSAAPLLTAVVVDATSPGEGEHKIFEAIRAFRSFESYDHNVTHCVCSSDTDVVVSALTLHEPFLYALRFDPSGPHEPTAFSIEAFRAALYERLQPRKLDDFEKALHDFVFVILLFGNDFLPRIADVADIAEGALDAFIKFLADNFVSRGKRLVDEVTGVVHVEAAVYLFDFLEDLPGGSKASSLSIEFGSEGDGDTENPWELPQPAATGGGGVDDLSEIAAAKEQAIRQQCFAYWTMLQWAMQYSCGPVPMWNAAYPYSTVPSIAQLRKYCGMDVETVKVRGVPDEPLDVFAQLLILTPPHSVQRVLPPALRYTSSDKISGASGASSVDDVATILARSFEDIPMSDIVAWCKSWTPSQ
ncbi:5-3 exonuclease XRNC, putative [Bodo saltans]|uniref:5-3 exonuclease XRNC, putative n=1 Tax=Bodo saltans TaxID=75058 RepID=A0A0S4JPQ7_BODSA|nr:5-3 exonuclease XRNC, putative [Bodo saltans]|eukprot:CUG92227.1 5-3 exonuclease XRNC, putative [Bodo saltans]